MVKKGDATTHGDRKVGIDSIDDVMGNMTKNIMTKNMIQLDFAITFFFLATIG